MKLTDRVQRIKPSPTLTIDTKAKAMQADGIDVIGFGAGEPDFDTPDHIKQAAIDALKAGKTKYTPVGGINELKDAILEKLKRDNGLSYLRDEVIVSCGGKHSLYNIAEVLFEAGDEVIIPSPFWVSYPDQVLLSDAKPVVVPTQEKHGFKITPEELTKAITPNTKAFILNSPSNPTGAAYSRKELEGLAKVLVEKKVACISDEIYEKIVYDGFKFTSIASLNEDIKALTITVNGASKVYSMTGWRMGYAVGPKPVIQAMTKLQGQSTTNINSMTQWASVAALNGSQEFLNQWVAEFKKRRDYILKRFSDISGVTCYKPEGAFYVFPNISAYLGRKTREKILNTDEELSAYLLEKYQVAVVAGTGFGAPGFIRLSYATSMENIEKGLNRIEQGLKELE